MRVRVFDPRNVDFLRRAVALGVGHAALNEADDADNVRTAVIALIVEHETAARAKEGQPQGAGAPAQDVETKRSQLKRELHGLKMSTLKKRAVRGNMSYVILFEPRCARPRLLCWFDPTSSCPLSRVPG